MFELYIEKYYKNKQDYILEENKIEVFSHEKEEIFDSMRERNIMNELNKIEDEKSDDIISEIIIKYFLALKKK